MVQSGMVHPEESGSLVRPEVELVKAAVAGDRNAAAELIERHAPAVYAVCLGLLADGDQAQDAAQDALLKAIEKLASLRDPSTFRSWIISIAHNLCRDFWKQTRRRQQLLDEQMERGGLEVVAGIGAGSQPIPGMGTVSCRESEASGLDIQAALARLPEKYRIPLLLYYFDGLSSAKVAEALGISPTGAGARLCRARRALREILEVNHG
jgi:RNA polymerase sigma-70 factor (ECF subfamily)